MQAVHSPFSRLKDETSPAIGHNQGPPLEPGRSWRAHCWRKARRELVPHLPVEVVRRRVVRARELGLAYPQYASVLLGTGRDIVGFLFTCEALGLRLARGVEVPEDRAEKLRGLIRCERFLMVAPSTDPGRLGEALRTGHAIVISGAGASPGPGVPPGAGREAIAAILAPLGVPADTVVMIGTRAEERAWADAARTAKFFPAESYFSAG